MEIFNITTQGWIIIGIGFSYFMQLIFLLMIGMEEDNRQGTFIAGIGNMNRKWRGWIPFYGWLPILKHLLK